MALNFKSASDEELAAETCGGCMASFEELVYRYEKRIYGFALNSCRQSTDAREVTQDTFIRAYQAIAQFDSRYSFATWLFTIARRKCIDHYRAAPRRELEPIPDGPGEIDPSEVLARREEQENLWHLARRYLGDAQFQALWLRYAEDMSVAEAARVLGKTQTHVKVLLFRARQTLGATLQNQAGSPVPDANPQAKSGHPPGGAPDRRPEARTMLAHSEAAR
jgi:RNA polymerase sigma-70 factor (ECF subfamily)